MNNLFNEFDDDYIEEEEDHEEDKEDVVDLDLEGMWMNTSQLVDHITEMGVSGLTEEYSAVCNIKTNDPCTAFR